VWDQVTSKPLLTTLLPGGHTAFACTNDPIECLVLCEALLPMPALLLFGASAALELTPSQQSLPLVAHLAWCAAMGMELSSKGQDLLYCCSNTSADLTPLMVEAYHHAKQPGSAPQTGEDTVQVQRNPWCAVSISGEQMTRVSLHMNCYITWCPDWPGATSVAGAVAQQLLQPGSTGASSGGQQQQQGTASCSGGNQQQQRGVPQLALMGISSSSSRTRVLQLALISNSSSRMLQLALVGISSCKRLQLALMGISSSSRSRKRVLQLALVGSSSSSSRVLQVVLAGSSNTNNSRVLQQPGECLAQP
jgi:hypothetical protein